MERRTAAERTDAERRAALSRLEELQRRLDTLEQVRAGAVGFLTAYVCQLPAVIKEQRQFLPAPLLSACSLHVWMYDTHRRLEASVTTRCSWRRS